MTNDFDTYQEFTNSTALYPEHSALVYATCGLVGEACEYAAKVQKLVEKTYIEMQNRFIAEESNKVKDSFLSQIDILRRVNSVLLEASALGNRAELLKKDIRGKKIEVPTLVTATDEQKKELKKELGDCNWYISESADVLDSKLSEIIQINVDKLSSRKERGVLHGNGDNR